jgi:3-oxoadipate enol-lactonase
VATSRFAMIDGVTLHFVAGPHGGETPLIFVNSLGTDLRIWDGVVELLNHEATIRYDKRGHGLSDCPPGPYTLRDHVDDLTGLLDHVAISQAVLIGVSVGGMIALQFAQLHPARVLALILCDTGATIGTAPYWNERIATVQRAGLAAVTDLILTRWFSSSFAKAQPAAYRGYANMLARTPVEGYTATCAAIRDADLHTAAASVQSPTLVLCGDQDLATPPALGRTLAAMMPNARFALIEQAGHLPSIEQPAALAGQLNHFLHEVTHG